MPCRGGRNAAVSLKVCVRRVTDHKFKLMKLHVGSGLVTGLRYPTLSVAYIEADVVRHFITDGNPCLASWQARPLLHGDGWQSVVQYMPDRVLQFKRDIIEWRDKEAIMGDDWICSKEQKSLKSLVEASRAATATAVEHNFNLAVDPYAVPPRGVRDSSNDARPTKQAKAAAVTSGGVGSAGASNQINVGHASYTQPLQFVDHHVQACDSNGHARALRQDAASHPFEAACKPGLNVLPVIGLSGGVDTSLDVASKRHRDSLLADLHCNHVCIFYKTLIRVYVGHVVGRGWEWWRRQSGVLRLSVGTIE